MKTQNIDSLRGQRSGHCRQKSAPIRRTQMEISAARRQIDLPVCLHHLRVTAVDQAEVLDDRCRRRVAAIIGRQQFEMAPDLGLIHLAHQRFGQQPDQRLARTSRLLAGSKEVLRPLVELPEQRILPFTPHSRSDGVDVGVGQQRSADQAAQSFPPGSKSLNHLLIGEIPSLRNVGHRQVLTHEEVPPSQLAPAQVATVRRQPP
jgi:hypothetical protein